MMKIRHLFLTLILALDPLSASAIYYPPGYLLIPDYTHGVVIMMAGMSEQLSFQSIVYGPTEELARAEGFLYYALQIANADDYRADPVPWMTLYEYVGLMEGEFRSIPMPEGVSNDFVLGWHEMLWETMNAMERGGYVQNSSVAVVQEEISPEISPEILPTFNPHKETE